MHGLLVAYAAARIVQAMPLYAAEGTFISIFALLEMRPTATIIPLLPLRLSNHWILIPLGAIFYPTLSWGAKKVRAHRVRQA